MTLDEAVAQMADGKCTVFADRRQIHVLLLDADGTGRKLTFPGMYASNDRARQAIAAARARLHLRGEAA